MKAFVFLALLASTNAFAADITISVPDNVATRVRDSYTSANGCFPNENKSVCMKRHIIQHIKDTVSRYESELAAEAARTTQMQSADAIVIS